MRRVLLSLAALGLVGCQAPGPAGSPPPRPVVVSLSELLPQASSGPLVGPDRPLGSDASTPFLTGAWGPPLGSDEREAHGAAGVRFYLSEPAPVRARLEGRGSGPVRVLLNGQSLPGWTLTPDWQTFSLDLTGVEGRNQLTLEGEARWRGCQLAVRHSDPFAPRPPVGPKQIQLLWGRSLELPVTVAPGTRLRLDGVQPWRKPGAPSWQPARGWKLEVRVRGPRLQVHETLTSSRPLQLSLDGSGPACLSLLALCDQPPEPGQAGLTVQGGRLEGPAGASPAPTASAPVATPAAPRPPNVIVCVVDTLRADALHCYGGAPSTPAWDALAADGVRFADCQAQSSWTKPSVASLMTGLLPHQHGAEDFPDYLANSIPTLAKELAQARYQTWGIVSNPFVGRRFGFAQGFAGYTELLEADCGRITAEALAWLAHRPADRPYFLYLHYLDPHLPYAPPAAFRPAGAKRSSFGVADVQAGRDAREARALYDGEVSACDASFARLVQALKASGDYARTLIVVVSDHGEQFGEHGLYDHSNSLYQQLLHVPLIVKFPENEGAGTVVEPTWQLIDVAPTILRAAGLSVPPSMQGQAYWPSGGGAGPPERLAFFSLNAGLDKEKYGQGQGFQRADMEGIRTGDFVLCRTTSTFTEQEPLQLYDLKHDPGEERNLAWKRPELRAWLLPLLRQHERRGEFPAQPVEPDVLERAMRSLQYLR